ncbi:MAG: DsbA family protein [Rhodospirillales bacterium]|nr:DsbA family protein [Alphaproteobacteria bacterium]MBL6947272.1 DsbA family protein [Rhodospirillales bacterium]
MSRIVPSLAVIALLLAPVTAPGTAVAAIVSLEEAKSEMVLGQADAPVTMVEFSSLGCPHCARFHRDTLPQIKKEYIDTGKVKLVYRDFPLGTAALAAAMVARCAGPNKFFGFIEILFRSQLRWGKSENPQEELSKVARFGGLSRDDVQACLKNQPLLEHIRGIALDGQMDHKVNSTPTFIIGDEIISGAQHFDEFKKVFDKALKK